MCIRDSEGTVYSDEYFNDDNARLATIGVYQLGTAGDKTVTFDDGKGFAAGKEVYAVLKDFTNGNEVYTAGPITVSYTHLDVYKRQQKYLPSWW